MAEFKDATPRDNVSNYVERIADAICGEEQEAYTGPSDRYRHALDRIATALEAGGSGSSIPAFTPAANQAASTATDLEGLVTDFNTLLASLKTAGLMAADGGNGG